jgi:hypothetical protein
MASRYGGKKANGNLNHLYMALGGFVALSDGGLTNRRSPIPTLIHDGLGLRAASPTAPQSAEDRHQYSHDKYRDRGRDEYVMHPKPEPKQHTAQERPDNGADTP